MPLIYLAIMPLIMGIIWSLFSPLPTWAVLIIALYFFAMGIKVVFEGFKLKRPKLVIDSKKYRPLLIVAVFFCIFSVAHAWYLTGGGSLYEPGGKYKSYVSATKEGVVFTFTDAKSFYFAKRAIERQACAFVLLAVGLFFSLTIKEQDAS